MKGVPKCSVNCTLAAMAVLGCAANVDAVWPMVLDSHKYTEQLCCQSMSASWGGGGGCDGEGLTITMIDNVMLNVLITIT